MAGYPTRYGEELYQKIYQEHIQYAKNKNWLVIDVAIEQPACVHRPSPNPNRVGQIDWARPSVFLEVLLRIVWTAMSGEKSWKLLYQPERHSVDDSMA